MIDFFTHHVRLKYRIHTVYLAIGSVTLLIVVAAYVSFEEASAEFRRFSRYGNQAQLGLQLANKVAEIQRAADLFTYDGHRSAAEQVHYTYREIKAIIDRFLASRQPISKPHIERIGRHLETYIETFEELQTQRDRQTQLVGVEIRHHASDAENFVQQYLASIPRRDAEERIRAIQMLNALLQVEKHAYRYFDSLDADHIALAKESIQAVQAALHEILATRGNGSERDAIYALLETISVYESTIIEAVQRTRGYLYLVNVVMAAEAYEILYQSRQIAELHSREMAAIEQEILSTITGVIRNVLLVGIVFFVAIVAFSYVVGKSITHPITLLTDTFRNLSHGSGDADIPPYRLDDEIGDLSHAAEVFRRKNNETRILLDRYQALSGELELKVEQRTRELADSNRKLLAAKEAAEAATRAKSDFLANMSHEIRTPMHAIIGMTYLVKQTRLDPHQQEFIKNIDLSSNALLHLINDILDFSKIEAGKLKIENIDFNLHSTIEGVTMLVGMKAGEKQLEFIVAYEPGLPRWFRGDPVRLGQVLTNLVNNAVKFTDRGQVGIDIRHGEKGRIRFSVWDTGIGLSQEQQRQLFQTFSQVDASITRKFGGTGLGLAISRQLVELMGGHVWVESEAGEGSRFSFEIALEVLPDDGPKHQVLSGRRVLVVEDVAASREVLKHLGEQMGLEVLEAGSGEEALALLQERHAVDLLIVDWRLSGLDGLETVRTIGERMARRPEVILLVPASPPESLRAAASAQGIEHLLPKPVNPSRFYNTVLSVFGEEVEQEYQEMVEGIDLKDEVKALRGSRILLVDDNRMNREIIHGMLADSGIVVEDAANGREAVELHRADPGRYEMILMDIQMPEMDGYEATRQIRQRDREVPIVALTADALVSDVEKTRSYGMNEHLNKPIDVDRLFAVLLQYLSRRSEPGREEGEAASPPATGRMPAMDGIDTVAGLRRMMGDERLYGYQLKVFAAEYADAAERVRSLLREEPEAARRLVHTIKGLGGNLAATRLHALATKLNETMDLELLPAFEQELRRVVEAIRSADLPLEVPEAVRITLRPERRDELLQRLRAALQSRRPQQITPLVEELAVYRLAPVDAELLERMKPLIRKYKYADALRLLEDALHAGD